MDNKYKDEENNEVVDDKHIKYKEHYKKNSIYWGLGIENELYLEFENRLTRPKKEIVDKRKRERYSVDYYTNYKKEQLYESLKYYVDSIHANAIEIPLLLNSNSFTRTDKLNNAKTLYTKLCEPNPKFIGETLIESLQKDNRYFIDTINDTWLFDGDTIEINTLHFFNTTLQDMMEELNHTKQEFIVNVNKSFTSLGVFSQYGKVDFMKQNHPFATYMTNIYNIAMFNNGTMHYNITLPTELNENCKIKDYHKFIKDQKKAIRIIQWMEPFLISIYGSPDPFSQMKDYSKHTDYSKASQRCAVSRYIGVGTYDSDEMPKGKILTKPIEELKCSKKDYWWFNEYYKKNGYTKLSEIGIDINFNKHMNHGIELRFFDTIIEDSKLFESLEFIIYLMDYVLENDNILTFENPILNKEWNNIVLNTMIYGKEYILSNDEKHIYEKIFDTKLKNTNVQDIFNEIFLNLIVKYNDIDNLSKTNVYKLTPTGKYSILTIKPHNRILNGYTNNRHPDKVVTRKCPPCIIS